MNGARATHLAVFELAATARALAEPELAANGGRDAGPFGPRGYGVNRGIRLDRLSLNQITVK